MANVSPTLTVAMIVRNEADRLPQCLQSIDGLWDELVIVDTGSTDDTWEWLQEWLDWKNRSEPYGEDIIRLIQSEWTGSFADARNTALDNATCDWIFVIDADEILLREHHKVIRAEIASPEADGYLIDTHNYLKSDDYSNCVLLERNWHIEGKGQEVTSYPMFPVDDIRAYMISKTCRLYRNRKDYRYTGAIHNEIHRSIAEQGGTLARLHLAPVVHHAGYLSNPEKLRAKEERQQATADRKIAEEPDNPQALWEYASVKHAAGAYSEAEAALKQVIILVPDWAQPFHDLGMACQCQGKNDEAAAYYRHALNLDPRMLQAALNLSALLRNSSRFQEAKSLGLHMITFHPRDPRAWNAYGAVQAMLGFLEDAKDAYEKALTFDPDHQYAKQNLATLQRVIETNHTDDSTGEVRQDGPPVVAVYDSIGSFSKPVIAALKDAGCIVYGPFTQFDQAIQADIWYTDWCDLRNLVSMSIAKPKHVRLVAHLFSYEAFIDMSKVVWSNVDLLVTYTDYLYDCALRYGKVPETVPHVTAPRGIDLAKWDFSADRDPKRLSWVSYINWKKGPQLLAQTAKHLAPYGYDIYVAGEFQDARSELCIENAITNWGLTNLHLCGWQKDINAWWDEINPAWHLSTSLFECLPFNVCEAAAKGIQPLVWWYPGAERAFPQSWLWTQPSDLDRIRSSACAGEDIPYYPREYAIGAHNFAERNWNSAELMDVFVRHILATSNTTASCLT